MATISSFAQNIANIAEDVVPGFGEDIVRQYTSAEVVFKTQISPDLRVDLLKTLEPTPPQEPGVVGTFANWVIGSIVKPEIQLNIPALGLKRSIAPYGPPTTDYTLTLAFFAGIGVVTVGSAIYFFFRRRQG